VKDTTTNTIGDEALNELPAFARAFFILGLQYEERGDWLNALKNYRIAQRLGQKSSGLAEKKIQVIKDRSTNLI